MKEIVAKTILAKVKPADEFWYHHDYNMNLYHGCSHGCIYCDSRSDCYQIENFDEVSLKKNALEILENELQRKRTKGIIGMGAMSDPYNPQEIKQQVTRGALQLIEKYGFSVSIATKSDLVLRDIDILERIAKKGFAHVAITITTADDELQRKIEPRVSSSSKRFLAIKTLREKGIHTGVLMMPVLPFINDTVENVEKMVALAKKSNAEYIYPFFGVTLRNNQRDYFYTQIDSLFPGIKELYIKTYKDKYVCESNQSKLLYQVIDSLCKKENILTSMKEINTFFKIPMESEQLSLF